MTAISKTASVPRAPRQRARSRGSGAGQQEKVASRRTSAAGNTYNRVGGKRSHAEKLSLQRVVICSLFRSRKDSWTGGDRAKPRPILRAPSMTGVFRELFEMTGYESPLY